MNLRYDMPLFRPPSEGDNLSILVKSGYSFVCGLLFIGSMSLPYKKRGRDRQNTRNFIKHGWDGVAFDRNALKLKKT